MNLTFRPFDEQTARAILTWRWAPPYDVYNPHPDDLAEELAAFLNPAYNYHAVYDATDNLIGYCCFGDDAQVTGGDYSLPDAVDIGIALRPDLVGRGLGAPFVWATVRFAQEHYRAAHLRATIAAFNLASQRVFARAGFSVVQHFTAVKLGNRPYVVMARSCAEPQAVFPKPGDASPDKLPQPLQ